jgi:hypothetical protein
MLRHRDQTRSDHGFHRGWREALYRQGENGVRPDCQAFCASGFDLLLNLQANALQFEIGSKGLDGFYLDGDDLLHRPLF